MSPGNSPYAITVGASNGLGTGPRGDDVPTSFSSKGPTNIDHIVKPDLLAPGSRVVAMGMRNSTLWATNPGQQLDEGGYFLWGKNKPRAPYMRMSGTSFAAAVVSGAAAIMIHKTPSLTPDTVKARLMKTAWKGFPQQTYVTDGGVTYSIQSDVFAIGAGLLDVNAALNNTDVVPVGYNAVSPVAVVDPTTSQTYLTTNTVGIPGMPAIWGSSAIWGASAIWGNSAILGSGAYVSGNSAIWGSSAIWRSSAIWGAGSSFGNNAIWGASETLGEQKPDKK